MIPGNPSAVAREYIEHGKSETCPIVDMHGHFGPLRAGYLPSQPVEKLRRRLKRCGVKRLVCSAHDGLFGDLEGANEALQEAILQYPDTFLGYWVVNPHFHESIANAGAAYEQSQGFVGFKLAPDYHNYPVDGERYAPVLEYANAHGLLVLSHTWGKSPYSSPQQIGEAASRYPNAIFLMGHSGYGDWEASLEVARACPNVYLELTAVYVSHDFSLSPSGAGQSPAGWLHVNGIIEHMVATVSSERMLFGTDMPWYSPHYAAGAILFARISDEARHDIMHRNAERLLARWSI